MRTTSLLTCVSAERVLGFRHANGQVAVAGVGVALQTYEFKQRE